MRVGAKEVRHRALPKSRAAFAGNDYHHPVSVRKSWWMVLCCVPLLAAAACTVGAGHSPPAATASVEGAVTFEDLLAAPVPGLCRHEPGRLANGILPLQNPRDGFVAIAQKSQNDRSHQMTFGDVTGDGIDDGAFATSCSAGGVAWPATVQVYTRGANHLGGVDLGDLTHGREFVTGLSITGGRVEVRWLANGPEDAACCPTVPMAARLRWDGSAMVVEDMREDR